MVISYLICGKAYKTLFSFISFKSEGMHFILINNNYYQFFPEPLYSVVKESITMKGAIGELFGVISVPVNFFWQGIMQFFGGIAQSMVLY